MPGAYRIFANLVSLSKKTARTAEQKSGTKMSQKYIDTSAFPAPVYAETVLSPNFEDAKNYFLDPLLEIHYAHTRMLAAQGILTASE